MTNFLDFIGEPSETTITLNGHAISVSRARFGLHLQLSRINEAVQHGIAIRNRDATQEAIVDYLCKCGIDDAYMRGTCGEELLFAYMQLVSLNALKATPAVLKFATSSGDNSTVVKPPPYDYDGRYWAWMIATIADRFGWSEDEILNLQIEAAFFYLQEALIMNYNDAEMAHQLSELSYTYDEHSKKSTYHPIPKPAWMAVGENTTEEIKKVRVPKSFLPAGTITKIDGSEFAYVP